MNESNEVRPAPVETRSAASSPDPVHSSHLGPMLGILLILLVLILIGLWLWGSVLVQEPSTDERTVVNNEPETPRAMTDMQIFGTLSSSNELDAIDADVSSTNLDSFDADLNAVEIEMNAQ